MIHTGPRMDFNMIQHVCTTIKKMGDALDIQQWSISYLSCFDIHPSIYELISNKISFMPDITYHIINRSQLISQFCSLHESSSCCKSGELRFCRQSLIAIHSRAQYHHCYAAAYLVFVSHSKHTKEVMGSQWKKDQWQLKIQLLPRSHCSWCCSPCC